VATISTVNFGSHAVAVTSAGSELDKYSRAHGWLNRFPMWDWVGGRTSELSAVGQLPAALQGFDIDAILSGAALCDTITRASVTSNNPAALLALMFHYSGNDKGGENLVVLPYKDRLELFSKYLQQLTMESLGKWLDLSAKEVNQDLTVLRDRPAPSLSVEPNVTSGDYLEGFYLGTRLALHQSANPDRGIVLILGDQTCCDQVSKRHLKDVRISEAL
jgi:glucose-6-phosphate isomerase